MFEREKDLYPIVEDYLVQRKSCLEDYVGNELFMGSDRHMRADVFGIAKNGEEKLICLLEGKLNLVGRGNFSKVLSESIPLMDFADFVYIFGISDESEFKLTNEKYYETCKSMGIGILILNQKGKISEILKPKRNEIKELIKKEIIYRIFFKKTLRPIIPHLILQAAYEYIKNNNVECAQFIEIYNALFSNKECINILRYIIGNSRPFSALGMKTSFQNAFGNSNLVDIGIMSRPEDDYICLNKECFEKTKEPILLDNK